MRIPLEKPGTPGELVLAHHGVKGMHWGVRKNFDLAEERAAKSLAKVNDATKEYLSIVAKRKPITKKEFRDNIEENQQKFYKKFGYDSKKGLSPTQKKLLIGAGIGVAAGVAVGGIYAYKKYGGTSIPGTHVSMKEFEQLCYESKQRNWGAIGNGYVSKESFLRPEFELSAGHTFHRVSGGKETTFAHATYSTTSIDEFKRYLPELSNKSGANHVTWQSTAPIKVPGLTDTLNAFRQALADELGVPFDKITPEQAVKGYSQQSGGSWIGPTSDRFFKILSNKGYGAIVDEMDAGIIAERPLVLFSRNVTPKVNNEITGKQWKKLTSTITEINGRR